MNPPPDSTLADPHQLIADLQRANIGLEQQLALSNAERDEALAQRAATAEILRVISASPTDLRPTFDAIAARATTLCGAVSGSVFRFDGSLIHFAAHYGWASEELEAVQSAYPMPPGAGSMTARAIMSGKIAHSADVGDDISVHPVLAQAFHTVLAVPMMRDGKAIGAITVTRRQVEPFSQAQIALLETFAVQAVIAMENARLLGDLRARTDDLQQSLEYQTATSDVLKVISRSTFDLQPVLDTLVETAAALCDADGSGIALRYGDVFRYAAVHAVYGIDEYSAFLRQQTFGPGRDTTIGRVALEGDVVHIADIAADPDYALTQSSTVGKIRTNLGVPLLREGAVIGMLTLFRQHVEPFTDRQIELVCTFADQAVIAIENARLIAETREALEQQTATAEVLGVINSSPGNLAPVFDAMLEKAMRLCDAAFGLLLDYDGQEFHGLASYGALEAAQGFFRRPIAPTPGGALEALLAGESVFHVADLTDSDAYRGGDASRRYLGDQLGARTAAWVALRKDAALVGAVIIYRQEVRLFTEKQIALLENFAAQAVIAMENARLITETREALDQQTATAEVLQVINASPGDLTPVFDAMLDRATRLSEAAFGILWTYDGERFQAVAFHDVPQAYVEFLQEPQLPSSKAPLGRVARGEAFAHVSDLAAEEYREQAGLLVRQGLSLGGFRTVLAVPMRKDASLLGAITIYRREVQPFADKQITLLQNFAAQAVIAMENARLITETREALEQQTATAEILRVISASTTDLQPAFDAIVERTINLCDAEFTAVARYEDGLLKLVATNNLSPDEAAAFHSLFPRPPFRGFIMGRAFVECQPVNVADVLADPGYDQRTREVLQSLTKYRSFLAVPIIREGVAIGVIGCARREVRPFTATQVELVSTFADQAVIAIENARLLGEIQQRQAELRVTFDNMADGVAMFDQTLHLAAWNRNFQELLDLPDELLAERPEFDAYIRYLTERGEFGERTPETEIARLRSRLADHYSFERTRPDGTVVEIRNNPMPDGGVVFIYSDITERKRSEAEIRAARDAAEAAYTELKAAQANLIQAEKMASLGQLTAGIAHEIKNPLNFVNNFASLSVELLDELKEVTEPAVAALGTDKRAEVDETIEMLSGNLEKIAEHGKRADNIVKSMLEHSRGVGGERREVDLNNLIEEALNLAYHGARAQNQDFNITLERDYAANLKPIELAPQEITRVFLNLFGNGFYAANKRARANGDGSFHPVLAVATCEAEGAVEVRVRDNGTGIPPEIRDKLFQPFFTTKPTGEGTGLGLSISYDIVTQQHGGTITVESEPGAFTEFTVRLPRH